MTVQGHSRSSCIQPSATQSGQTEVLWCTSAHRQQYSNWHGAYRQHIYAIMVHAALPYPARCAGTVCRSNWSQLHWRCSSFATDLKLYCFFRTYAWARPSWRCH